MEETPSGSPRLFRLWITTYVDWRPAHWNETPPRATAIEPVEEALYSAQEAALFLEGFNSAMIGQEKPIWAVAVPITIRYEGDAQPGMPVEGYAFAGDDLDIIGRDENSTTLRPRSAPPGANPPPPAVDHFQGFGQSPQRSR
jgi:hypothetical protein